MQEFHDDMDEEDDLLPRYEAECHGCDIWGPVDGVGLCSDCAGKLLV